MSSKKLRIPFLDLGAQYREIKKETGRALKKLMLRGDFILGKDVGAFETSFARYTGSAFSLGVNSGTDALFLGLLSLGVGSGDEVIVPAFTYIASAFAVTYTGAKPVFVDIDADTFNIDPGKIEKAVTSKTRAIMPVHLYGQSADMEPILEIAKRHGLKVIEDAAQAHGTVYYGNKKGKKEERRGRKVGSMGDMGCFSFYPTKNLGGFGDGGMITTNDNNIFDRLKKMRDYGRKTRYEHVSLGYNSRLDSMQALVLNEKLKKLDSWNEKRIAAAKAYDRFFEGERNIVFPKAAGFGKHVYHIYAVRVPKRNEVLAALHKKGIAAAVHYPVPLHLQEVYASLGYKAGDLPVAERTCREVLCLPIHPHITKKQIHFVAQTLKKVVKNA
jgi:dTDP-4-amino-4,6-dideoxygalactose transaminase